MRVRSIMSRISQCFRHSGRFSDVFVCGLTSAPRWLWDGSGTHYLGCGDVDVFCLRSHALCFFMRHETWSMKLEAKHLTWTWHMTWRKHDMKQDMKHEMKHDAWSRWLMIWRSMFPESVSACMVLRTHSNSANDFLLQRCYIFVLSCLVSCRLVSWHS